MINTKLILIEGISGSGKSSTAHYLSRQLNQNQIKNRWFHEEEKGHPLSYDRQKPLDPGIDRTRYFIENYPQQWADFAKKIEEYEGVCIVESFFTQFSLIPLIMKSYSKDSIMNFMKSLYQQIEPLNPIIIFNYYNDVKYGLDLNLTRRGKDWENWYLKNLSASAYAKENNLDGYATALSVMKSLSDNSKEFMNTIPNQVIELEISSQNWDQYYQYISEKLNILWYPENHPVDDFHKYSGLYQFTPPVSDPSETNSEEPPKEIIHNVHISNNRLCLDAFWPNLRLFPLADNLFSIEAFHFLIRFNMEADQVISFDFIENSPKPFLSTEDWKEEGFYTFYRI